MIHQEYTGVILAGGLSNRIGKDKALLEFRGVSLILNAVSILKSLCIKVVISAKKPDYQFTGCEIWPDESDIQAPMIGIYTCLKRIHEPWMMVLSCDMPFIDPRLFDHLASQSLVSDHEVVVPVHHGNCIEPLCGLYSRRTIPLFEKCIEARDFSMQHFIKSSKHKLVEIEPSLLFYRSDLFSNINTAGDLEVLG
jgi:molybdopterin-guanine dinucleotide biosynthesis protein A